MVGRTTALCFLGIELFRLPLPATCDHASQTDLEFALFGQKAKEMAEKLKGAAIVSNSSGIRREPE